MPYPGIGFYPVNASPYDRAYFDKYVEYSRTELGRALNAARVNLVLRCIGTGASSHASEIVDVGIGCGQFVESLPGIKGYDVNPAGVEWLTERRAFFDPNQSAVDVACFWDSLEHIADPARVLANVDVFAFVSIPIFRDLAHVQTSKHFRTDEHYWYFTDAGFRYFMREHGFEVVEANEMESELGREDIGTYALQRTKG